VRRRLGLGCVLAAAIVTGCGLQVQAADLFLVTRTGEGQRLSMLVNDDGTISCNGGKAKQLPDPLLLAARDLATSLNNDVKLRFTRTPASVFTYTVKVPNGTFTFPDTAASARKELAQLELFVIQAAADPCEVSS
jgi:hypothetical protein